MDEQLLTAGILLGVAGAIVLAFAYLYPEASRRENRRAQSLLHRARDVGLRGDYNFEQDPSKWGSVEAFGTYRPVDDEDRALYADVGARIEGEAAFFANEMLWTNNHLAWIGVPLLLIGIATCLVSIFS